MLEFYKITDRNKNDLLYSLSESFFEAIKKDLINNKINIDLYGTTRLYPSQISILVDILERKQLGKSDFHNFLIKMKDQEQTLIVEGE